MAKGEEYEIMPHRTIKKIKKEIESLKKKSKSAEQVASPEFKKSMDNLTRSMNSLMELFKEAAEDMKIEDRTQENIDEKLGPLVEKVSQIEDENKRIAEGIVVVADMVKELKQKMESKPIPRPMMLSRGLPELKKPPIKPPMTGRPLPPRMPPRKEAMPPPGPLPPRMPPGSLPPRPPSFTDVPIGMPPPPPPPGMEGEKPKKKGLFGLFKK